MALAVVLLSVAFSGVALAADGPNGRVYEKITPADKNGGDAKPGMVFDRDHVTVSATASFLPDDPFYADFSLALAARTGNWSLMPGYVAPHTLVADVNRDFSQQIVTTDQRCGPCPRLLPVDTDDTGDVYARTSTGLRWISQGTLGGNGGAEALYRGQAADGSKIFFETTESLEPGDAGRMSGTQLYERVGTETRVVGLDSDENLVSDGGAVLGHGNTLAPAGASNAISADGSRAFFESPDPAFGGNSQLYVRINDEDTVRVSASQCDREPPDLPCNASQPAVFQGASTDGSVVFFTTVSQLLNEDTDEVADLYRYVVSGDEAGQLTRLSKNCIAADETSTVDCDFPGGLQLGQVEGMIAMSASGQRVYFANHDSIWFFEDDGPARYVAPAGSSALMLGLGAPGSSASATPDGRYLLFESPEQLTSFDVSSPDCVPIGSSNPEAPCTEVYRYIAETHEIDCISCNTFGAAPAGHSIISGALFRQGLAGGVEKVLWPNRIVTDDGSIIAFESGDALVPQDTDGAQDVYEWNKGTLALIGSGDGKVDSGLGGVSAEGNDIFFATTDQLVLSDVDLRSDLYDARVGGTREVGDNSPPPCQDEQCQPVTPSPTFAPPSSLTMEGHGNFKPSKPKAKPRKKCKHGYVRHRVRGKVKCVKQKPAKHRAQKTKNRQIRR